MSITDQVEQEQKQATATTTIVPSTQSNSSSPNNFNIIPPLDKEKEPMLEDIKTFKEKVIDWAKTQLADGASILETKEVKDLVSMVDTIEKSLKPKETDKPMQVNILVQNLMEAKDDC